MLWKQVDPSSKAFHCQPQAKPSLRTLHLALQLGIVLALTLAHVCIMALLTK